MADRTRTARASWDLYPIRLTAVQLGRAKAADDEPECERQQGQQQEGGDQFRADKALDPFFRDFLEGWRTGASPDEYEGSGQHAQLAGPPESRDANSGQAGEQVDEPERNRRHKPQCE